MDDVKRPWLSRCTAAPFTSPLADAVRTRAAARRFVVLDIAGHHVRFVGAVYAAPAVIWTHAAAPRCRMPTPNWRAKKLSWSGYPGVLPGINRRPRYAALVC